MPVPARARLALACCSTAQRARHSTYVPVWARHTALVLELKACLDHRWCRACSLSPWLPALDHQTPSLPCLSVAAAARLLPWPPPPWFPAPPAIILDLVVLLLTCLYFGHALSSSGWCTCMHYLAAARAATSTAHAAAACKAAHGKETAAAAVQAAATRRQRGDVRASRSAANASPRRLGS